MVHFMSNQDAQDQNKPQEPVHNEIHNEILNDEAAKKKMAFGFITECISKMQTLFDEDNKKALAEMKNEIQKLRIENERLQSDIAERDAEISEIRTDLKMSDKRVSELENSVKVYDVMNEILPVLAGIKNEVIDAENLDVLKKNIDEWYKNLFSSFSIAGVTIIASERGAAINPDDRMINVVRYEKTQDPAKNGKIAISTRYGCKIKGEPHSIEECVKLYELSLPSPITPYENNADVPNTPPIAPRENNAAVPRTPPIAPCENEPMAMNPPRTTTYGDSIPDASTANLVVSKIPVTPSSTLTTETSDDKFADAAIPSDNIMLTESVRVFDHLNKEIGVLLYANTDMMGKEEKIAPIFNGGLIGPFFTYKVIYGKYVGKVEGRHFLNKQYVSLRMENGEPVISLRQADMRNSLDIKMQLGDRKI